MIRRPPSSTLTHSFPTRRSSDLHGFDPRTFLDGLPLGSVQQIHLAGHSVDASGSGLLIDTHHAPVCDAVWSLSAHALRRFGAVPAMIERDDHIPQLDTLQAEQIGRTTGRGNVWPYM